MRNLLQQQNPSYMRNLLQQEPSEWLDPDDEQYYRSGLQDAKKRQDDARKMEKEKQKAAAWFWGKVEKEKQKAVTAWLWSSYRVEVLEGKFEGRN